MDPYVGEIKLMPITYAPEGWLFCNGAVLQITQYQALYALLGIYYGGDGRTTFQLPDLRGRVPVHNGYQVIGTKSGVETVTLSASNVPQHIHQVAVYPNAGDKGAAAINGVGNHIAAAVTRPTTTPQTPLNLYAPANAGPHVALNPATVGTAGGNAAYSKMQPYLALNYFIAWQGIFPSRA